MPQSKASKALLTAFNEYFLITLPVGLYVALEATHHHRWELLVLSPEWSMATIFLLFQGLSLYTRHLNGAGAKVSAGAVSLMALTSLLIAALTLINAYSSLTAEENTKGAILFRLGLFGLTTVGFLVLVAGATLYRLKREV
ncbi:MAG TPA: hypothetical protein VI306_26260 [Pyrinomonadaceae bacterium]